MELRLLMNVMESIAELLKLDIHMGWQKTENSIAYAFERNGGLDALEDVQKHQNYNVYQAATEILTKFFEVEDPITSAGNQNSSQIST